MLKMLIAGLLVAVPVAAPAQSRDAAVAAVLEELNCVRDGAMAAPANSTQAQSNGVIDGCKQRFGWDGPEAVHAVLATQLSLEAQLARRELIDAGVDFQTILRIWRALTSDETASIREADRRPDAARTTSSAIVRRLLDAGVPPAQVTKAGGTIVKMVQAASLAGEFLRLRVARAAGRRPLNAELAPGS